MAYNRGARRPSQRVRRSRFLNLKDQPSFGGVNIERNKKSLGELPIMSIENPTLAHFRHFRHSVPRSFPTDCTILKGVRIITYFQTHSILTNKPNFQKSQMNVTSLITMEYENKRDWIIGQNKPNQSLS